ncbi:MAG TPA: type II secretion system F family protein [Verrucomicrobiae bacterium]
MIITPGQLTRRADFYFQLASLQSAGVPIIQALEMVRSSRGGTYRREVGHILSYLQQGCTLGDAVERTGNWLPAFDRALINAGEKSGRLDTTFRSLGDYYTEKASMLRELISGMAYPIFVLHLAVLIFPTSYLTRLFWNNGVQDFVLQKAAILIPAYLLLFIGIYAFQGSRGEHWRSLLERLTYAIPLVAGTRRDLAMARLSGALEALLSAGVNIIQAWELAADATASARIKRAVTAAVPKMEAGVVPSETLNHSTVFPELFRSLYKTGEISGQLDATLDRLRKHYEEQASLKLRNLANWTPKLVFLCVALGVGYSIIKFYMGYFDQLNKIGF